MAERTSDVGRQASGLGAPSSTDARRPTPDPRRLSGWFVSLRGALVLLGLVAAGALGTALYLARQARLEEEVLQAYEEAEGHYRRGDLAGARDGFARAWRLVRALDRRHFLAAEIRRKHGELRLVVDLLPISLEELARQTYAAPSPEAWQETFRLEHAGRTVIFDTALIRSGAGGQPGLSIGYEVHTDDGRRLALDFAGAGLFEDPGWTEGERVIFGATLARMTWRAGTGAEEGPPALRGAAQARGAEWTLHFEPDGCVPVLDGRLLEWAGFEVDEGAAAVIARQRERAGAIRSPSRPLPR